MATKKYHGVSYSDIRTISQFTNITPASGGVLWGIKNNEYSGSNLNSNGTTWQWLCNAIDIYWGKPSLTVTEDITSISVPSIATTSDLLQFIAKSASAINKAHSLITALTARVTALENQGQTVLITGITLSKSTLTLTEGGSETLTVTAFTPSNATTKAVTWSSSNNAVATVTSAGKVTAVKAGTCTITATAADGSGITAKCSLTVNSATVAVTGISVSPTSGVLENGKGLQLTATISPSNATDKGVTWSSGDNSKATVSSSGYVTAKVGGNQTVKITATANGNTSKYAECTITLKDVTPSQTYKYYVGRDTTVGTADLDTTDYSTFWASSSAISKNSIAEIKAAIKDTIDVGSPTGANFFIIVAPTEVITEITKIETLAGKTVKKEPLTESNGYTTLLCGPFTGTQVNVIK